MYLSPDPLLAFQGKRGTFRQREEIRWKEKITKIKELYSSHSFKQCAALCEECLVNKPAHPLHETFLRFHAAICHESLGLLAHKYSNNKLLSLNKARDHFTAALAALPLPYCTTESGRYDCLNESPQVLDAPPTPSSIYDPSSPTPLAHLSILEEVFEIESVADSDEESDIFSVPDFNKYTSRQLDFNIETSEDEDESLPPWELTLDQRKRLSESLSKDHVVQEALLPKPLFAKKLASVPPPPAPRALPPIPTRNPVLRKTALQTLLNPSVFAVFKSSPLTPRFNQIRDSFDPKFSQGSNDRHLRNHNILLSSFRTQLLQHITAIDTNIFKTTTLQTERHKNRTSRLASIWSIKQEDVQAREKQERIDGLKKSGWDVSKRAHGWKGREYYEELRSRALADVEC